MCVIHAEKQQIQRIPCYQRCGAHHREQMVKTQKVGKSPNDNNINNSFGVYVVKSINSIRQSLFILRLTWGGGGFHLPYCKPT